MTLPEPTLDRFRFLQRRMNSDPECLRELNAILTEMAGYRAKLESAASVFSGFFPADTKARVFGDH